MISGTSKEKKMRNDEVKTVNVNREFLLRVSTKMKNSSQCEMKRGLLRW